MKSEFKKIKTKKDYELALKILEKGFHAESGSEEFKLMLQLANLIEDYEAKQYPIEKPNQTTIKAMNEVKAGKTKKQKSAKDLIAIFNK
jgi:HTH-type transcriptional regulator / antitoxin HigA